MKVIELKGLLQNEGWLSPAFVSLDREGRITKIASSIQEGANTEKYDTYGIPGFQNAHSHSFQYAMAGLAEKHALGKESDDFWSWRDAMYKLALTISPDQLEIIATQLYAEMLRHGYTNVAEFHYLHHDKNGKQFSNLSEMGERLVSAAKTVGIGITLVPIYYQKGGFGLVATDGQKRFLSSDNDSYLKLLEASKKSTDLYKHANTAIGIHSMRGVEPELIKELANSGPQDIPFHIHISEQLKEIEASKSYLNKRPVEWFLDNIEVNDRYHLVHATHLVDEETRGLAQSGANVVICPSTEGNLGDGIFPLIKYQNYGGNWSIGTDSHIGLNPFEELRILDYGQRLVSHKRNIFTSKTNGNSASYGINQSLLAGRKAMNNFEDQYFKVGEFFDAVLIDANHPLIASSSEENILNTVMYSADSSFQKGTFSKGELVVDEGKHKGGRDIGIDFVNVMNELKSR